MHVLLLDLKAGDLQLDCSYLEVIGDYGMVALSFQIKCGTDEEKLLMSCRIPFYKYSIAMVFLK